MTDGMMNVGVRAAVGGALRRVTPVIIDLAAHFTVAVVIIALVWALEAITLQLSFEPVLFGRIDMRYVFNFIDFAVVISFAGFAALDAMKLFRSPPPKGLRDVQR